MPSECCESFDRFCCDRDVRSVDGLFEEYRPWVATICRKYLRDDTLVDDAIQETFVKLMRQRESVRENLKGWLASVAANVCLSMLRSTIRERRRREAVGEIGTPEPWAGLSLAAAEYELQDALNRVDNACGDLLRRRFINGQLLRDLAQERGISVPTASRRIAEAITELRQSLKSTDLHVCDEASLGDFLYLHGEFARALAGRESHGLRKDHYRPQPGETSHSTTPIRVGALVCHASTQVTHWGFQLPIHRSVEELSMLLDPRIELVALVEPGTDAVAGVERTVREFDLTAGVIDASDRDGLRTLDVIYIGMNFAIPRRVLRAIRDVVREGVGLYCEGPTAAYLPGYADPIVRELHLADMDIRSYLHDLNGCANFSPAAWQEAHPAFPGMAAGDTVNLHRCAPWYVPREGVRVLATSAQPLPPTHVGIGGERIHQAHPAMRVPFIMAGTLGRGRVLRVNTMNPM